MPTAAHSPDRPHRHRWPLRRAAALVALTLALGLGIWAGLVVPVPYHEIQPGGAHAVEDLVALSSTVGEVNGDLDLLTVRRTTPNAFEAAWIALHPDRDLRRTTADTSGGLDRATYLRVQRDAFRTSFLTAVAVAAEQAGHRVELETRAVVAQVLAGGPSDGQLRPGDVITVIDGVPVESADTLVDQLGASDQPRPVALRVDRDGQPTEVTVDLRELPDGDRPVLGIVVDTVADEPVLPFDATMQDTNIIGPSAGLMLALTATDMLLAEDLTAGRTIAGTGTIARDGSVGMVSGVELKARAALAAGAELLLVPAGQVADARSAVAAGVEVVGVTSLQDALEALRSSRSTAD